MSVSVFDVLFIINVAVPWMIYIPLLSYYGWKYYKSRHHIAIIQIYASITIIEIVCCLMYITSFATWRVTYLFRYFLYDYIIPPKLHNLLYAITAAVTAILFSC